uniref:Phage ABA sandwich domain-containing protein n=1 Tax=viral metagenome TaxID=1070528 RepID=A0A6M3KXF7_9ZZZZ
MSKDRKIAELVMGWKRLDEDGRFFEVEPLCGVRIPEKPDDVFSTNFKWWHPTTNIEQAFMVVEKIGGYIDLIRQTTGKWVCYIKTKDGEGISAMCAIPAEAICDAAIAAMEGK